MVPHEAPELLERRSGLVGRALSPWKRQLGLRGAVNTEVQPHFEPAGARSKWKRFFLACDLMIRSSVDEPHLGTRLKKTARVARIGAQESHAGPCHAGDRLGACAGSCPPAVGSSGCMGRVGAGYAPAEPPVSARATTA